MPLPEKPNHTSHHGDIAQARRVRVLAGVGLGLTLLALLGGGGSLLGALGEPRSGVPSDAAEIARRLERRLPRAPIVYTIEKPDGTRSEITIPLEAFSLDDALRTFLPAIFIGIIFLLAGVAPVLVQLKLVQGRALAILLIGLVGNYLFLLPDYLLGYHITPWGFFFGFLSMAGLWHFALIFPSALAPMRKSPRVTLGIAYSVAAIFYLVFALLPRDQIMALRIVEHMQAVFLGSGLGLLLLNQGMSLREGAPEYARRQAQVTLPALLLVTITAAVLIATTWGFLNLYIPPIFYLMPFAGLTITFAWGMISSGLFELDSFARKILGRSTLLLIAAGLFSILLGILEIFIAPREAWTAAAFITLILSSALPLIPPVYNRVESFAEQALFPQQRQLREALVGISREIGRLRDTKSLAQYSRRSVADALSGTQLRLVIGNVDEPLEEVAPPAGTVCIDLPVGDPIREALARGQQIVPHLRGERRGMRCASTRSRLFRNVSSEKITICASARARGLRSRRLSGKARPCASRSPNCNERHGRIVPF